MDINESRLERLRVVGRFETKIAAVGATDDGTFSGYGSVFNDPHETSSWNLDPEWKDVVAPGAFTETLAGHKTRGTMPAMFLQHEMSELPIGAYSTVREDEHGLFVEGKLALKVQRASDTYELMKIGAMRGLSIGFVPTKASLDQKSKMRTIQAVDLMEISPVSIPADPMALISDVKGRGWIRGLRDFETFLRVAGGYSRKEAKAIAAEGYKVLGQRDADAESEDVIAAQRDADADEIAAYEKLLKTIAGK